MMGKPQATMPSVTAPGDDIRATREMRMPLQPPAMLTQQPRDDNSPMMIPGVVVADSATSQDADAPTIPDYDDPCMPSAENLTLPRSQTLVKFGATRR